MGQNLIQLLDASKSFGTKALFEHGTFAINEGEHIGFIGPNGAGKTTLLKVLIGEQELDHGEVVRSRDLRIGYLQQFDTWNEGEILEDFLQRGTLTPIWDLKKWGLRLGLSDEMFYQPIQSLSGGYRMRVKLLHLLGQEPNLMLLDEPTNYLDLETVLVLEEFLQDFEGAFLLISHDREFLRRTTDHILEVESGELTKFSGNIDDYFEQKALLREQLEARAMSQAAKRDTVLKFAARFGAKASKARQAQSRLKQLAKMETIELKSLPIAAKIRIPEPSPTGRLAIEVRDADFGYEERVILQHVNMTIESGDHLGVVGLNGAGKSTTLKTIAQVIKPLHGEVTYGYQVNAAYYAQHVAENLLPEESVLDALSRVAHRDVKAQDILDIAGSLLFSGDAVRKKVKVLSGGEKARVCLGQMLLKKAPLLLLDEPTNHLDFYTVEALTQALAEYKGTVIVVSHDRGFIRRIASKILEVDHGRLRLYPGSYDEYVWSVQNRRVDAEEASPVLKLRSGQSKAPASEIKAAAESPKSTFSAESLRAQLKDLENQKRVFDKTMQDCDLKMKALQSRMSEMASKFESASSEQAAKLSAEASAMQKKLDELEAAFMEALSHKEDIVVKIQKLKS